MPFTIVQGDITEIRADAIVNAANVHLLQGGGVCGAIFDAAGPLELQEACDRLAPIETGEAVVTPGFALPAGFIVHTAGPVYRGGGHGEEGLLRACYRNSLDAAFANGCRSIAFPLISSGIFGYPKDEALSVATGAITDWLFSAGGSEENEKAESGAAEGEAPEGRDAKADMDVMLVVFDKRAFAAPRGLSDAVEEFLEENFAGERRGREFWKTLESRRREYTFKPPGAAPGYTILEEMAFPKAFEDSVDAFPASAEAATLSIRLDEPFSAALFRLIDAKGKTDVEVYKRANLDRKLFSKIRKGDGYMPSKKTAVALAVALELTLDETNVLLGRAGFALSRSLVFDVIVEYFITERRYDVFEINNMLFEYDQPLLGA